MREAGYACINMTLSAEGVCANRTLRMKTLEEKGYEWIKAARPSFNDENYQTDDIEGKPIPMYVKEKEPKKEKQCVLPLHITQPINLGRIPI